MMEETEGLTEGVRVGPNTSEHLGGHSSYLSLCVSSGTCKVGTSGKSSSGGGSRDSPRKVSIPLETWGVHLTILYLV